MSKALVIIKSMGIGDLVILIGNIHAISKKINKPVTVFAQKSTHANTILKKPLISLLLNSITSST